jgi:hypothetical protein
MEAVARGHLYTRCTRPTLTARRISAYTILGFTGYAVANLIGAYLAMRWQLDLPARLIAFVAPALSFIAVVTISSAFAGYERIVFYQTSVAGVIDGAFVRRLRFIVSFPFPDMAERLGIWQRAFPATAPRDGIDAAKLARLKLPGGNIRSIALNAAYLAAESGEANSTRYLLSASRTEFAKIERPFPEADAAGWC